MNEELGKKVSEFAKRMDDELPKPYVVGWSVEQKEAIRDLLQNYHHMIRHSVEAYKLEQRVATHYEDECIRKIEAITKGEQ